MLLVAMSITTLLIMGVDVVAVVPVMTVAVGAAFGGRGPAVAGDLADLEAVVASVVAWRLELQRDVAEV